MRLINGFESGKSLSLKASQICDWMRLRLLSPLILSRFKLDKYIVSQFVKSGFFCSRKAAPFLWSISVLISSVRVARTYLVALGSSRLATVGSRSKYQASSASAEFDERSCSVC